MAGQHDRKAAEYVKKKMSSIGVGTYQIRSEKILRETIDEAFACGYRLIDTAQIYGNESIIGRILPGLLEKHNLSREDIFITSKVAPANQGTKRAMESVNKSLTDLNTPYLDLVLIHWPGTSKLNPSDAKNAEYRAETYAVLEKLLDQGKVKAIGVSNYEVRHLEALLSQCRYLPAVNQCECHPHFPNSSLAEWCTKNDIHFQAYSSLGGPDHVTALVKDEKVMKVAHAHNGSPAVVLLAWALNQGYSVLPRTTRKERVRENWAAKNLRLSQEEIEQLSSLGEEHRVCWDPTTVA